MLHVKIKRLSDTAIIPTYGSEKAAGLDLYANLGFYETTTTEGTHKYPNCIEILPHQTIKIGTGFAFQPPQGYCGLILARSGLSTKQGLAPANKIGLCDEDYTSEYIVALHNHSDTPQTVYHGDRIAQLMFIPYTQAHLVFVDELDITARGGGSFGSTGR